MAMPPSALLRRFWQPLGWLAIVVCFVVGLFGSTPAATEEVGAGIGALLLVTAALRVRQTWRDWQEAETTAQWFVARRDFAAETYRLVAKVLIWCDLLLLLLLRLGWLPPVRRWVLAHPQTLVLILLAALALFSMNNLAELLFQHDYPLAYRAGLHKGKDSPGGT